jgi:hypothetical protein
MKQNTGNRSTKAPEPGIIDTQTVIRAWLGASERNECATASFGRRGLLW